MADPHSDKERLKGFLEEHGLKGEKFLKALSEFGVQSLHQLKVLKGNETDLGKFREKIKSIKELYGYQELLDGISVVDIQKKIDLSSTPTSPAELEKQKKTYTDAIAEVDRYRESIKGKTQADEKELKTKIEAQFNDVVKNVGKECKAQFTTAAEEAPKTLADLQTLLDNFISNAKEAKDILDAVEKTPRSTADIINYQKMLYGYFVDPGGIRRAVSQLIRIPEDPEELLNDPGERTSETIKYKGSKTSLFAAAFVHETGSSLTWAAEGSGAFPVGSGLGALSVAASRADAEKASQANDTFNASTNAECGEIHYIYAPQKSLLFDKFKLRLSDNAWAQIELIGKLPDAAKRSDGIVQFYQDFGTHFFLNSSLGGRYKFTAEGRAETSASKATIESDVAGTMQWATSASVSYAGLGGAAKAAGSIQKGTSMVQADKNQYSIQTARSTVSVKTQVLGGAGLAPQDVWQQSLRYNSVWEVIKREDPLSVWEIMQGDTELSENGKNLASQFEDVWIREVFSKVLQGVQPALCAFIRGKEGTWTCAQLEKIMEPDDLLVKVVESAPSKEVQHPENIASLTGSEYKLIGGGARVKYDKDGFGNILTGSYPHGNSWVASSKDHGHAAPATLIAYAIYLHDPLDLWEVKYVKASSKDRKLSSNDKVMGDLSNRPWATAKLPEGYTYTGGGALVEPAGQGTAGLLLTASKPELEGQTITGWTAKGKDHLVADTGHATAWAIGIKRKSGTRRVTLSVCQEGDQGQHPKVASPVGKGDVVVGGGAEVTWLKTGGALTALYPDPESNGRTWYAEAKDHEHPDEVTLTAYAIAMKERRAGTETNSKGQQKLAAAG